MAAIFGAYAALGNVSSEDLRRPRLPAKVQFVAMAIAQILRPPLSAFSRSREWAADRFAVAATNEPATGASAFRRLRDQNLAEDEQPAWFEFMFSTHPPLKARIAALENAT
jgi:Zn-dependent protease with chaperone function